MENKNKVMLGLGFVLVATCCTFLSGHSTETARVPTFYKDVLAVMEERCQGCHRLGGIAPMAFETYGETRAYAGAIAEAVKGRRMPPWFAERGIGHFANDPSLTDAQIATLVAWAAAGAPAGNAADAPAPRKWAERWTIPAPDLEVKMPEAVEIPATGDVDYTYEIVPTRFTEGRWVQASEILPGLPEHVHHAVVYVRPPGSGWLKHAPVGKAFTAESLSDPQASAMRCGRPAIFCWCTRRGARRTTGRRGWRSTYQRARTWCFKCTTRRMESRERMRRGSG